ncbi:DNA-binding protein [Microcystis aeruginosa KW]|uniref:DNA-binding protein n=1 Tax=Microcystis aeruginosa KW TaxID=1960155 RepID=A0A1V4BWT9_MICAE|nr:DNA-binding protein [Microcystis aeruginosa]OPF18951.1 DNA-binding protein [Microcystis aeruginosa KW]
MNELKGISINKLIEYLSTNTLAEFNAYTRFKEMGFFGFCYAMDGGYKG